ncbi:MULTISPECIES: TetR/AcrR family transcriptional regulator [unclassified Mycobacterium]|uniref:TetR/AcrR family transcriptional regulator n=1 Tax=unclassified Mycobacterium TaxID=2642494 RepID=UPI0029C95C19|nr:MULTISPECIES: TetR family transcriptional regulator [unclassified Mycobacterium]
MATRREQAQQRREQFIDAALAVFAAKGVDGTSIKDIAEAASVTPGLLYHYFTGKEALIAAVLTERGFTPQLRTLLTERADESASVVLPELVGAFDRMLAANADLVSVFFSESHANASAGGALREFLATGQSLLESYLSSRAAAGELDPELVGVAARTLFAAVSIGHRTGQRVEPDQLVQLILNGLIRD